MKRFSTATLLIAGLFTALFSFSASSPAAAAKVSPSDLLPNSGKMQLSVYDLSRTNYTPLAGATVMVWNQSGELASKSLSDAKGTTIAKLLVGSYKVAVSLAGYNGSGVEVTIKADKTATASVGLNPVTAPAQPAAYSKVKVTAYDASQPALQPVPVANALVVVWNSKGIVVGTGRTDKTGSYVTTLTQDLYRIMVTADGFQSCTKALAVKGNDSVGLPMWLSK